MILKWGHLFISDIHAGSLYFDEPALNEIYYRLINENIKCDHLHFVGDLLEGKMNHRGQLYEAFPADIQIEMVRKIIVNFTAILEPRKIHILPGNHDRKYSINLLDSVILKLIRRDGLEGKIEYYRDNDYYIVDNVLVIHGFRWSRGSDYLGFTPLILNNLAAIFIDKPVEHVVVGHYHRLNMTEYLGRTIYLLPSFQYSERYLRQQRGVLLLNKDGSIKYLRAKPRERQVIINYWTTFGRK